MNYQIIHSPPNGEQVQQRFIFIDRIGVGDGGCFEGSRKELLSNSSAYVIIIVDDSIALK